jgi:hypothetical protein
MRRTIRFMKKEAFDGTFLALIRIWDGSDAEQWTMDGWVPVDAEWSGIGGSTDYEPISVEQACRILIDLGAADPNPVH